MKKTILILLVFLSNYMGLNAQINVGNADNPSYVNKGGRFDEEDVEACKATTTVVFLQDKDKKKIADYQLAASQVWTFNKIIFTTISELPKYEGKPGYSFMSIYAFVIDKGNASSTSAYYLKFWLPYEKRNGKIDEKVIAHIQLYLDPGSDGRLMFLVFDKKEKAEFMVSDQVTYYNLTPGFMKCYLGVINKYLSDKKKLGLFAENEDKDLLKQLQTDTLFLPDYILYGNGMAASKLRDEKKLMADYGYKYRILTQEEIDRKILTAKKNTFVFAYIYFSSQKFYTIYEAQKGIMVYSQYENMSTNGLNDGDFKKIAKRID